MGKGKILVVDDDPTTLQVAQKMLSTAGHEVDVTQDPREALKMVKQKTYDIVYTDLVMGEFDGVVVCHGIKKVSPRTEVILISAYELELKKKSRQFREVGGLLAISKPFSYEKIAELTAQILQKCH